MRVDNAADIKEQPVMSLTQAFQHSAEDGVDFAQLQKIKDHNYAVGGKQADVGRIETNASQDSAETKEVKEKKKNEAQRLRELLNKDVQGFYDDMATWTLADFTAHGNAYTAGLHEKAQEEYAAGNVEEGDRLSKIADDFHEREQEIMNDPNLSDDQKKEALTELWKDQPQDLIAEFVDLHKDVASDVAIDKYNEYNNSQLTQAEQELDNESVTIFDGFSPN